jgi:hypothetical protein
MNFGGERGFRLFKKKEKLKKKITKSPRVESNSTQESLPNVGNVKIYGGGKKIKKKGQKKDHNSCVDKN